jgi:hypothetical protein
MALGDSCLTLGNVARLLSNDQIESLYLVALLMVLMAVATAMGCQTILGPPEQPPVPVGSRPRAQQ